MPQIQTESDKNPRNFRFLKISCNFCLFFEWLGGLECQRRSKREKFFAREASSKIRKQFLQEKNCIKFSPKLTKILENSDFWKFYANFVYFSKDLTAWNVKDVQQGKHRCPGVFCGEVKADCADKMHQIHTKNDKKKFRFLKISYNFCVFFGKLGGLEN